MWPFFLFCVVLAKGELNRARKIALTIETLVEQSVISLPQIEEVKIQRERRLAEGGVISLPPLVEVKIEELGLLPFEKEVRPATRLPNLLVRAMTKSNNQLSVWQPRKKTNRL